MTRAKKLLIARVVVLVVTAVLAIAAILAPLPVAYLLVGYFIGFVVGEVMRWGDGL